MCLLGIVPFTVKLWFFWKVISTKMFLCQCPYRTDGIIADVCGVGSHVGDEADGALAGLDALVELLGDGHGLAGGEAQPVGGSALEGAGAEGRLGVAAHLLLLDLGNTN